MEPTNTVTPKKTWSAPGLAARSGLLGLMVFMAAGVALVPLGNRKLTSVFWVGAAVNLLLFCGISLAAPIVLLRRVRDQAGTPLRRVVCILSYALGWLLLPSAGLAFIAGSGPRTEVPRWEVLLFVGMVALFGLIAIGAAIVSRRGPRTTGDLKAGSPTQRM